MSRKTSHVALNLPTGLAFEEWEEWGQFLRGVETGVQWWVGDWLN